MDSKTFILVSDAALDLRGPVKESFVNHFVGMLQGMVLRDGVAAPEDILRMVNTSVEYAKSQHNEN